MTRIFVLLILLGWTGPLWAATVTDLGDTWNASSGTHTVTATPAVGDVIVILTGNTTTSLSAPSDNQSGTYVSLGSCVTASSGRELHAWIRTALVPAASSTVFTAPDAGVRGGLSVLAVRSMGLFGIAALLQFAKQDNQALGGTPAPVLGAVPETGNPIITAVMNADNPANITARTGYTTDVATGDGGTYGIEILSRNSGETSATITWGGTSATAFCSMAIELEARTFTKSSYYSSTFTHTDTTDIGTEWDAGYTSNNNLQIVSNAVEATVLGTVSEESLNAPVFPVEQYITGTIGAIAGTQLCLIDVTTRATAPATVTHYRARAGRNWGVPATSGLLKDVSGSQTTLLTENATTWAANDTLEFWIYNTANLGNHLILWRNGVPLLSAFDSDITASKRPGMAIYEDTGGTLSNCTITAVDIGAFTPLSASTTGTSRLLTGVGQ